MPEQKSEQQSEQQEQQQPHEYRSITRQELEELAGEPLPERAAMSLVNANLAIPVNLALAANILSDNSVAGAIAEQDTPIDQSTGGGLVGI